MYINYNLKNKIINKYLYKKNKLNKLLLINELNDYIKFYRQKILGIYIDRNKKIDLKKKKIYKYFII